MSWIDTSWLGDSMSWINLLGYAASATVLVTFCMRTMIPLRLVALASNVLFIAYGYVDHLCPVLLLHALLLPVNTFRLLQFYRLVQQMRAATGEGLSIQTLLPYMTRRTFVAGETLVRKGERADCLYYLADGELEITDFKKVLVPGAMVGEIGVFAPNQERTATIICRTHCSVLELTESTARQLYFQDRAFGFAVLQLIISRLVENNEHLLAAQSGTVAANVTVLDIGADGARPAA
jgi:CRP/FNR family transcriptional regulator, cyclic AMP receptor protein